MNREEDMAVDMEDEDRGGTAEVVDITNETIRRETTTNASTSLIIGLNIPLKDLPLNE